MYSNGARGSAVARAMLAACAVAWLASGAPAAGPTLLAEFRAHARSGRLDRPWMLDRLGAAPAAEREELWRAFAEVRSDATVAGKNQPFRLTASESEALRSALLAGAREMGSSGAAPESPVEAEPSRAIASLDVLGALGEGQDLALAADIALAHAGTSETDLLAQAFELAAEGILARDVKAWAKLRGLLGELPLALLARLLAVVGRSDSPEKLESLLAFLGHDAKLDAAALSQIARDRERPSTTLAPESMARLRALLGAPHGPTREQAALVAGRLEDEEATSALLALLEDESHGARANARWALKRISGLDYRAEDPRWRRWYEAELQWWAECAPALLQALHSSDRVELVAAVNELAKRRLFRKDLVQELAPLTRAPDRELAALACNALGTLESPAAVPALLDALARPEDGVRGSASAALTKITGRNLPPSRESWMRALQRDA